MKYVYVFNILAILIILLLVNCAGREKNHPAPMTNQTQYSMLLTDNEQLPDPLILDGKPFVGSGGKAYRKDEAYLIEFFGFNFDSDADRWYSLEGIEQLFNLKYIQVYGENLAGVDLTPLASLSNLEKLSISGNITHLPDLTRLENLRSIRIEGAQLESFEGIGAPNLKRMEIGNGKDIDSLSPLNNLLYLEYLQIGLPGEKEYKIADMANLPSLKTLTISTGKIDLQGIENLSALEGLWLDNCQPFNIEGIGRLTNLEILLLNLTSPAPSLRFLQGMPNIVTLNFEADIWVNGTYRGFPGEPEAYQVLDVSPLATLKNLQSLTCFNFIIKNISSLDVLDAFSSSIYLLGSRLYDETEKSKHDLVFKVYK